MDTKELYREILNEHNINPIHKEPMDDATIQLNGVNPSCGDNITLYLKTKDGKIESGSYQGSGCAISQASCDMMLDLVIGKTTAEALRLGEVFINMIKGTASEEEIEELDEAAALKDISHMPSRVKCAVLGWRTLNEMLGLKKEKASAGITHPDCPV
ncbi:MAG: SUF system NifU family Fe-S cluster assembly protein [Treponema sp.]|nr:SUF system NifU family Fe-S cluster assembly protein [Treponema sp.]